MGQSEARQQVGFIKWVIRYDSEFERPLGHARGTELEETQWQRERYRKLNLHRKVSISSQPLLEQVISGLQKKSVTDARQ